MKVVLVSGASDGFGHGTAKQLAERGHKVYAFARREEKMADLKAAGVQVFAIDITDGDAINNLVDTIIANEGRIDVLVNNAGYGCYGVIEAVDLDLLRRQYEVNVFGMARLLQAVLPHMRKARSGRIVNLGSVVSHVSAPLLGWYASTKHAVKAMSESLRMEVRDLGIDVVQIEPGAVRTGFEDVAFGELEKVDQPDDYAELTTLMSKAMHKMYDDAPEADGTVKLMVKAVEERKPKAVYKTTSDSKMLPIVKRLIGDKAYTWVNLTMAKRMA